MAYCLHNSNKYLVARTKTRQRGHASIVQPKRVNRYVIRAVETTPENLKKLPLPNGTMGLPFIGETQDFMNSPTFHIDRIKKYGPIFKSCIFRQPTIFIYGYDNIKTVIDDMSKIRSEAVESTKRLLGAGALMAMNGKDHLRVRKLVSGAFSPKIILKYIPDIEKYLKSYIDNWCEIGTFKFIDQAKELSLRISADTVLGMDFNKVSKEDLLNYHDRWWEGMFTYPVDLPFTPFGKGLKARENLISIIDQAIEEVRSGMNKDSALARMITALNSDDDKSKITISEIEDSFLNMLVASSTTAPTMAVYMLELMEHPEIKQKIKEEQDDVISKFGTKISVETLLSMPYLEAVIKESLRVRPVVPVVTRRAIKDFEVGGYLVPKGWQVMLGTGISTKYFDRRWPWDVDFKPERWLSGEGLQFSPEFMAFGSGPHLCLGGAIAMLIMKIAFALMSRSVEWEIHNPSCKWQVIPLPEPIDRMPMTFKRL